MGRGGGDRYEEVRQGADPRAVALYEDALVWDMMLPFGAPWADYDTMLPRFHAAGIDIVSLTVQNQAGADLRTATTYLASIRAELARRSDQLAFCTDTRDILAAKASGRLAVILNHQDGTPLNGMPEMVEVYHALGIRTMLPTYNRKNELADGCAERTDEGLSRLGERVVREMLRVGILVDGTHVGRRSSLDMAAICAEAGLPFSITHSNAHAVHPHYRNVTDEQIRAAAATGGAVGVNGLGEFLFDVEAGTNAIFRHLDHIVTLVGPQHAGIGLDYLRDTATFWANVRAAASSWPDPPGGAPRVDTAFAAPEQFLELTDRMVRHGWPDEAVRGVLGLNWLRVTGAAWGEAADASGARKQAGGLA